MVETSVSWDDHALSLWLATIEEEMLPQLAAEVAAEARAIAPVAARRRPRPAGTKRTSPGLHGKLKASVQWDTGRDYQGGYADIAAFWYGRFLDPRARQLRRLYPFLPTALFTTLDGRDIYVD